MIIFVVTLICALSVLADYSKELAAAKALAKAKKPDEAIKVLVELAEKTDIRDRNAECLREAALIAHRQKKYEKALELAKKIRNRPLSKACQMGIMFNNRKNKEFMEVFENEDIDLWPENCVGTGFFCAGEAGS